MEWLAGSWLILLLVACCVAMMFMHGGHGKNGKNDKSGDDDKHQH